MHDQSSFWAAIATMVVWVVLAAVSVLFLLLMRPDAILAALFVAAMAGIGVAGTHVVWDNLVKLRKISLEAEFRRRDDDDDEDDRRRAVASSKAKRERAGRGRLDRLIETLDDDEIIELESLLMSRGAHDPD